MVNIVGVLVISFLHKLLVNYKEGDIMFAKIGFRIKQARINAQITQDTLAELIGCSTSFISRLECGKVSTSLETLLNIWSYVKKKYKLNTTNFLFLCNC